MAEANFKPKDLIAKVQDMAERAKGGKNPEKQHPTKGKKLPSNVIQLPIWPEPLRTAPNAILRSSLFTVSKTRPIAKNRELLAAVDAIEIRFKGERFNQTDLDVWEMLLHLARSQPLGDRVEFSAHALLKALGRKTSGEQYEQLKEQVMRLVSGGIEITWTKEGKTFIGHLIDKAYRDEGTQRYVIVFNDHILDLYDNGYSRFDWSQRQALGSNLLAKWLHGFYATHAVPFPYKVETLRKLSGSTTSQLYAFRQILKKALDDLVKIKAIKSWLINDQDLVIVQRSQSLE